METFLLFNERASRKNFFIFDVIDRVVTGSGNLTRGCHTGVYAGLLWSAHTGARVQGIPGVGVAFTEVDSNSVAVLDTWVRDAAKRLGHNVLISRLKRFNCELTQESTRIG